MCSASTRRQACSPRSRPRLTRTARTMRTSTPPASFWPSLVAAIRRPCRCFRWRPGAPASPPSRARRTRRSTCRRRSRSPRVAGPLRSPTMRPARSAFSRLHLRPRRSARPARAWFIRAASMLRAPSRARMPPSVRRISTCTDSNGDSGAAPSTRDNWRASTYTVTATSGDGLSSQASLAYTVVGPPTATISAPEHGKVYPVGAKLRAVFSCVDGAGAPGLAACVGSNGAATGRGAIATAAPGHYTFTVTAFSEDGAVAMSTITYTVAARPTITISNPPRTRSTRSGSKVKVHFKCRDGRDGPGIAKCTGTVRVGGTLNATNPVGGRSRSRRRQRTVRPRPTGSPTWSLQPADRPIDQSANRWFRVGAHP